MTENLATALQIQTLDDITRKLVKGAPQSPRVNGYKSEHHYVYRTDVPMGQAAVDEMHMASYISEAATTSWEIQVGMRNQESVGRVGGLEFTTSYLLRCVTDRPSGLRISRRNWLYLNTATSGQPTFVREQDAASIDFTDAGLQEFNAVYGTGYNSEATRDYIEKMIKTEPDYAATVAGFISQACGVNEQVDVAPETPKEPFVAHEAEAVTRGFCADFSKFVGGLSLYDQVASTQR